MNDIHNGVVEICFSEAGKNTLKNSILNRNEIIYFSKDFVIGDINNIDREIDIDSSKKVCIYSCRNNIHDYLSFIYLCSILNNDISVVFTDDYSKDAFSLSSITPKEINDVLKYEKILSKDDIERYKNEWVELSKENSELRIIKDKKVISVSYDYLDKYIKECLVDKDINKTIANMILNDKDNNFSDKVCYYLVERYLNNN